MAPWIPRLHLFEINDQPWFPPLLRSFVQDGLMHAWTVQVWPIQKTNAATFVANILHRTLGASISRYTMIDFCAGAGGPTGFIEKALNERLRSSTDPASSSGTSTSVPSTPTHAATNGGSYAEVAAAGAADAEARKEGVHFVLTDLHPHVAAWEALAKKSDKISYVAKPVDAADAPADLVGRYKDEGKQVFRLFNLAFHHFDDPLAKAILKNTVETSDGFGIFELQDRSISSFISCFLFGGLILLLAIPYYWWSPLRLVFVYLLPIVPFVLVFDGIVSSLRTRTPEEVQLLLQNCGADVNGWEMKSGCEQFMYPTGYLTWVICQKRK